MNYWPKYYSARTKNGIIPFFVGLAKYLFRLSRFRFSFRLCGLGYRLVLLVIVVIAIHGALT